MKKIIVLILLVVAVAWIISGDLSARIGGAKNAAQVAGTATSTLPTITYTKNEAKLQNPRGVVTFYTYLSTNSPSNTTITLGKPIIVQDGTNYLATSTDYKIATVRIVRKGLFTRPEGAAKTTQPFEIKKGKNIYLVQWSIDSALLPTGTYKMSLSTYTVGASTTSVPITPLFSNQLVITNDDYRTLHGQYYRLESYNNKTWANASTAPVLAFRAGRLQAQFCGASEGIYQVVKNRLVVSLKGSQPNCSDTELKDLENLFVRLVKYGMNETLSADGKLKLKLQIRGGSLDMTFVKFTPTTIVGGVSTLFPPRIYPCDFVGPLEVGAIRDCGLGLGVTPGGALAPDLTYLSPITVARGGTVTASGSNFASSTEVYFTGVTVSGGQRLVATANSTSTATSLQFVVPQSVQPGIYSVHLKTINGFSAAALTLIVQ